jgi:serine protease Do
MPESFDTFKKRNVMKNRFLKTVAPAALILAGVVFGMVASSRALDWPSADVKTDDAPIARTGHFTASYANVVKKAAPSVVNISTTRTIKLDPRRQFMGPLDDPLFRRFFGDQFEGRGQAMPRTQKENSLGSGIIVTKDGYIITNNHVVEGADEIKVTLSDKKTELDAKIIGRDPKTDIAIVKINGKNLPFATLANSDLVEVGDVVLAIGSPFGLARSVTMGIVSAVGRGMGNQIEEYEDFIQTDAAINPGNSGGALVDAEGRVVGINTAILSRTGGNQGVGFAVPINLAKNVMESLLKNGRVERGFLGVAIQDLTPALAKEFKVPETGGALVGDVTEKSAAGDAGIKSGDVIIELNGKAVSDARNLRLIVGQMAPGTKVSVKVLRQGAEKTYDVVLKAMPSEDQASLGGKPDQNAEESDALNGVTVGDITPGIRQELNLPPRLQGAVITELDPATPAYEAGLREGDVVVEINHQPVKDSETAVEISKHIKSKQILLRVFSRGGVRYIVVDESKKK